MFAPGIPLPPRAPEASPLGARVLGDAEAPATLILIGGIAQIGASWAEVASRVHAATGARVVLPDNPGICLSRHVPVPRDCEGHARLHAQTLASLGITGAVHIAGLSLGSMIAAALAAKLGPRSLSLTLCAGSCKESGRLRLAPFSILRMTGRALIGRGGLVGRLPELVQARMLAEDPGLAERLLALRRSEGGFAKGVLWRQLLAAARFELVPLVPRLPHQRVVVVGTADRLVPASNSGRMAMLLGCSCRELAGHGHYLALDGAAELAQVLVEGLKTSAGLPRKEGPRDAEKGT